MKLTRLGIDLAKNVFELCGVDEQDRVVFRRNDAEAIAEAVGRPSTRFVAVKSEADQAVLSVHRARDRLVKDRTALINQLRGLLAEFGVVVAQGGHRMRHALPE